MNEAVRLAYDLREQLREEAQAVDTAEKTMARLMYGLAMVGETQLPVTEENRTRLSQLRRDQATAKARLQAAQKVIQQHEQMTRQGIAAETP